MGPTFAYRIMSSSGCSFLDLSKAWIASRDIFVLNNILQEIEALDHKVDCALQNDMIFKLQSMIYRSTRWLIRNHRDELETGKLIRQYQQPLQSVAANIEKVLMGNVVDYRIAAINPLLEASVPASLAAKISCTEQFYALLSVISVALKLQVDPHLAARVYFYASYKLKLFDIAKQLNLLPVDNNWQSLAKEAMCDDLEWQQQRIARTLLTMMKGEDVEQTFNDWETQYENLAQRWYKMADSLLAIKVPEFSMCQVALRELLDLSK